MEEQTNSVPNRHKVKTNLFPISLVCWVLLFVPLHLSPSALNAVGELKSSSTCKAVSTGLCQAGMKVSGCYRNYLVCHFVPWRPDCSESRGLISS